jgi:hypothetical protein
MELLYDEIWGPRSRVWRVLSSGMWHYVVHYKLADVSEIYTASILNADKQEIGGKQMAEV